MDPLFSDWRYWPYEVWNERLIEYYFARQARSVTSVERIPATPDELAPVTGDGQAIPEDVVRAFIASVRERLPLHVSSFCGFALKSRGWSPAASSYPHYFALLWLTCLIAYGYPDTEGGFYERSDKVFGRRQNFDCVPGLWRDFSEWTRNETASRSSKIRYTLTLPPDDRFRTLIGHSWFLAFPHQNDRRKLREILTANDLIGEEPPIAPVVEILERSSALFSDSFREDLNNFKKSFLIAKEDIRNSAFWRAIRQEAIREVGEEEEDADTQGLGVLARLDDDGLFLYVACKDRYEPQEGYLKTALPYEIGGFQYYLYRDGSSASVADGMGEVAAELFDNELLIPPASRHIARGVLVFKEELTDEYRLVAGAEANEASVALVRDDKVKAFLGAYGGLAYPSSSFPGWHDVTDCEVVIRRELPSGLERVFHLQETMFPPGVRLVGGIRGGTGFLKTPGFLPRVRFSGADKVELFDPMGHRVHTLTPVEDGHTDWSFGNYSVPNDGEFRIVVAWTGNDGEKRTSELALRFVESQLNHRYKPLGTGRYYVESCSPGEFEVSPEKAIPLDIWGNDLSADGPELIDFEGDLRYLGPGCGEMSSNARPGFDWAARGPMKHPSLLLFVGDPSAPRPPENRRSEKKGDRRNWKKAFNDSRYKMARLSDGSITPVEKVSGVVEVLGEYRRHNPGECTPQFSNSDDFDGALSINGVEPDDRVAAFEAALAALAVNRRGLRLRLLIELLSAMLGDGAGASNIPIFELVRGWAEAGALDVAYAHGQRGVYVAPRRPSFVAYRTAGRVRASLVGLVHPVLRNRAERLAKVFDSTCDALLPPCKWLPKSLRVECEDTETLQRLSDELELDAPRWLRWPIAGSADFSPEYQGLPGRLPGDFFKITRLWDWTTGQFADVAAKDSLGWQASGVSVEMRFHKERNYVYTVSLDGEVWVWSHHRNWILLFAYSLKDGQFPFIEQSGKVLRHTGLHGVYLPLPVGHLCAVVGEGLAGPVFGSDGNSVKEYVYPLGRGYVQLLRDSLWPRSALTR